MSALIKIEISVDEIMDAIYSIDNNPQVAFALGDAFSKMNDDMQATFLKGMGWGVSSSWWSQQWRSATKAIWRKR